MLPPSAPQWPLFSVGLLPRFHSVPEVSTHRQPPPLVSPCLCVSMRSILFTLVIHSLFCSPSRALTLLSCLLLATIPSFARCASRSNPPVCHTSPSTTSRSTGPSTSTAPRSPIQGPMHRNPRPCLSMKPRPRLCSTSVPRPPSLAPPVCPSSQYPISILSFTHLLLLFLFCFPPSRDPAVEPSDKLPSSGDVVSFASRPALCAFNLHEVLLWVSAGA